MKYEKEDSENIYIEDYIIPKGTEKADFKIRTFFNTTNFFIIFFINFAPDNNQK